MLVSEIPGIIQKLFPRSVGIIFTGSQVDSMEVNTIADVDLMVFNFQFSVVSTLSTVISGIPFDITLVPLYDIENVLLNESLHYRGILLSMIANGRIIKDSNQRIIVSIKSVAGSFYSAGHIARTKIYEERVNNLGKLSKEFRKKLGYKERFLLVNDFIYHMSQIEIAKASDWIISEKQKSHYLTEKNGSFVDEMIGFAKDNLFNEATDDLSVIADYINAYVENATVFEHSTDTLNRYVVDIDFKDLSVENLHSTVLKNMMEDEFLSQRYLFCFTSPKQFHRIFYNNVSLVFQVTTVNDTVSLNQALKKLFETDLNLRVKTNTKATYIYTPNNKNSAFCIAFEEIAVKTGNMINSQILEKQSYSVERNLNIGIILFAYVFKYLNCTFEDIEKCLTYLIQRYFFMQPEQRKIKNIKEFLGYKNKKLQLNHLYYFKNKHNFIEMTRKGLFYNNLNLAIERKEYSEIIDALSVFLSEQTQDYDTLIRNNQLTYDILHNYCGINEADKALLFILSFEQLVQLLHFDFSQKGLCVYLLINSIGELKKQHA